MLVLVVWVGVKICCVISVVCDLVCAIVGCCMLCDCLICVVSCLDCCGLGIVNSVVYFVYVYGVCCFVLDLFDLAWWVVLVIWIVLMFDYGFCCLVV